MDILTASLVSFLVTLVLTPVHIKTFMAMGIVGEDRHKLQRPKVPEMGGIAIFLGIAASYICILSFDDAPLAGYALFSICIVFLVGVIDDIYAIRQRTKLALLAFSAVPLLFYGEGIIDLSFVKIGYGPLYAIMAIIGMAAASNLTNILEGFNGESIGLGVISTGFMIADSWLLGNETIVWILFPVFASLLAFLLFNRYPSKVFPGDTGTLLIGASIGISVILGGHVLLGVIVLMPQIIEF
ncbi:MAG: hypothetical protein JW825_00610, partial [Candidatus Methanofastidiosa archaeon]|nr:hypothetical protein [Candidatus Methanofastidiosa archaeon]